MADAPEPFKRFTDALAAKGVRGDCPMCGHNDWGVNEKLPVSQLPLNTPETLSLDATRGYPTYWINCENCGFVAHFLKSVVDGGS